MGKMNSRDVQHKVNKGVQKDTEAVLKVLRDKTLTLQEKAAKIEELSGIEKEGGE